ncbi:MAG: phosphotransferase [Chloroflexi bacterium]|nr:phosphotransferase [Chloroflexota bacterium]
MTPDPNPLKPARTRELITVLGNWELPEIHEVVPRFGAHVFRVSTVGSNLILKDLGEKEPDVARLEFLCEVLEHVDASGLAVSNPLRTRDGQPCFRSGGRTYQVYRQIDADPYPQDPVERKSLFSDVGQSIAQLHESLAAYRDPGLSERTWREDHVPAYDGWVERLTRDLSGTERSVVSEVARVRGAETKLRMARPGEQLIHRDLHPGNVLVRQNRVVGFIDCDHLSIGQSVFDLAYYAANLLKAQVDDAERPLPWLEEASALVSGYREQRPFSEDEMEAFPHALLCYHLLLATWFLTMDQEDAMHREIRCLRWLHVNFDSARNIAFGAD